jgi:DDB1- and CUL4-associated factor 7
VKTQLIAHDKEVYDFGFMAGSADVFGSVGADGSVRMFDLRNLEHSTIVYETADSSPLVRLAWNKQDPNYMATLPLDSNRVIIIDIRVPSVPVTELSGHAASVNAMCWAPHSSGHICTASEDSRAFVWDLSQMRQSLQDPILCYTAQSEINQLAWNPVQSQYIAIASGSTIECLRL